MPTPCPDPALLCRLAAGDTASSIPDTILIHLRECGLCAALFDRAEHPLLPHLRDPDETTPAGPPAVAPTVLGRFELLDELGAGGMGVVYRARDTTLDREVAVKLIRSDGRPLDPRQRARFEREARAVAKLDHPHVVPVHEVGEAGGVPYLVMPLLAGRTLAAEAKERGTLPPAEVCRVGGQIARALAAAHAAGLAHRDVKPANVWLEAPDGTVRVLDFGLARSLAPNDRVTETHGLAGTPAYMSPEQADAGVVDARSDLFSLGSTLYELVHGRPLFANAEDRPPVLAQVRKFRGLRPADAGPGRLGEVIARLLSPDPAGRPTAAEVAELLASGPGGRRRFPWPAVVAAAVFGGVGLAVALVFRPTPPTSDMMREAKPPAAEPSGELLDCSA